MGTGRDARFGPIVLVSLGGVYAEIFGDVAVALARSTPTTRSGSSSHCLAPLCRGARGRPRVDLAAAAEATAALSRLGATYRDVDDLEIDPLPVTPAGAVALDAPVFPRDA